MEENKLNYDDFLKTKQKNHIKSGFEVDENELNNSLFDFQKFVVKLALNAGKYAIFAGTGLGKTLIQLEIADKITKKENKPILILCPLAISGQTIKEGIKFGYDVAKLKSNVFGQGIFVINYEQLRNIDESQFCCVILDESSILKNETGAYRNEIIEKFKYTKYKYCLSATPNPNSITEIGSHVEFLDVMTNNEMLAMYFVNDSKKQKGSKWRLKGHAIKRFYEFLSTFAIMFSHPRDIGFEQEGYDLPKLNIVEKTIKTPAPEGKLFSGESVSATDYHKTLRETEKERLEEVVSTVELIGDNEPIIIWTKQNPEAILIYKQLTLLGYDCRNVQGSDSQDKKERDLLGFSNLDFQILITKEKIASMGLNYQHCANQIFSSIDFSFEKTYQALRRSWRFGQKRQVNAFMITTDGMLNVAKAQKDKQKEFNNMQSEMIKAISKKMKNMIEKQTFNINDVKEDNYLLLHGDCVQRIKEIPDKSIDIMIFSPPFADLYVYSNKIEDMGNVKSYDEFKNQFTFLVKEIKRVIKPGRIVAVHSMNLPTLKGREGYIGLRRFNSMIGDLFEDENMFLHSEHAIWKDPLLAAVRTKTKGLAHKTLCSDSVQVRTGIFDLIQCFKTKEENETPIEHDLLKNYIPMGNFDEFPRSFEGFNEHWGYDANSKYDKKTQYSHHIWQRYASPVWMDIKATDTLQYMCAKGNSDERHICPLQLPVIDRLITLYSKEGETLLSPFGGIGSEGYQALKRGRKSISIELKESYFEINKRNHRAAIEQNGQLTLF